MASKIKKVHKKKTINFIKLWDEIFTAKLKKDDSNYGDLRQKNIYCDMLGLYSKEDNVTFLYTIDGYPKEIENSYITTLRSECLPGVRISFISPLEKTVIDWNSAQMRAKLRTWKTIEQQTDDVDEYNLYQNLNTLDSQQWRKDSLVYLSTAELRRKRKMFRYRTLMLISGKRGEDFNNSLQEILKTCKTLNIKYSRVTCDIPEYLKCFSPFSNTANQAVYNMCGSVTLPDEIISRFNSYSQGTIGRDGIYWGTDIFSCFPCLKPVKRTSETAENWLITAETGGGKSFFVKGLLVQLLAKREYNGTIMDIEGFEYIPLANYLSNNDDVVVLNMGEGTGAYYDPVEIIVTGDEELDADMYSLSTSFTLALFKSLLGDTEEKNEWVDIIINDAVSMTYGEKGVDSDDMSTWKYSEGLTLFDVYAKLKTLKSSSGDIAHKVNTNSKSIFSAKYDLHNNLETNDVTRLINANEGYQKALDLCIGKISRYFEPNGVRAHLFRERITIDQIKDSKLVICSFGMAGKAQNTVDPIQMALMQLYSADISHLRSIFSKHQGKYNFKLWEEFQRWGGFPDADKTINVALTGGRKLGDINIIVTNKVIDMLNDDKFGVFSNITSIAIGSISDAEVRAALCDRLTIQQLQPELDIIGTSKKYLGAYIDGDTLNFSPYTNAFLIGLDRTVYTISRMSLPKELRESTIFRTGINLKVKGSANDELKSDDNLYDDILSLDEQIAEQIIEEKRERTSTTGEIDDILDIFDNTSAPSSQSGDTEILKDIL